MGEPRCPPRTNCLLPARFSKGADRSSTAASSSTAPAFTNGPPLSKHSCCETRGMAASAVLIRKHSLSVRRGATTGSEVRRRRLRECQRIRCQPPRMADQRELGKGHPDRLPGQFSHVISTEVQPCALLRRGGARAACCPRAARYRRRTGHRRRRPGRTGLCHRPRRVGRRGRWHVADPMTCTPRTPAWPRTRPVSGIRHGRHSWAYSRRLLGESKGRSNVDVLSHALPFGRRTAESPRPANRRPSRPPAHSNWASQNES